MPTRRVFLFLAPVLLALAALVAALSLPQARHEVPPDRESAKSTAFHEPARDSAEERATSIKLGETIQEGVSIAVRVGHVGKKKASEAPFREGDDVKLGIEIQDATSSLPITRAHPAGWLVKDDDASGADDPRKTANLVKALLEARYFTRATLDFNSYYVLTLNEDSISVVDPLYGFGGMKLLALVPLGGRGADWALAEENDRLFVTVPEANRVVVIDTRSWEIVGKVATPPGPSRIGLQPGSRSVWVACESSSGSVAACIDVEGLKVVAKVNLESGPHDLAFQADGRFLVVSNAQAGSVTIIETGRPEAAVDLPTAPRPVSVAYSDLAHRFWIAHEGEGAIVAVDPEQRQSRPIATTGLALSHLRFTPDGRLALAVGAAGGQVVVLDATRGREVQRGRVDGEPERISFSENFAYIRRRSSPMLRAIPLEGLGVAGRALADVEIPMGSGPLGQFQYPTPADGIVLVPGGGALLAVNGPDRSVHYYKEGMQRSDGLLSS